MSEICTTCIDVVAPNGNCTDCGRDLYPQYINDTERQAAQKTISRQQSKSLHKWLELLANELNNNGTTIQDITEKVQKLEICPSKDNLKEIVVKPYIKAAFGLESHLDLNNEQFNQLQDAMVKFFGTYWGLTVDFPTLEQLPDDKGVIR